jgi:hypothetical protein
MRASGGLIPVICGGIPGSCFSCQGGRRRRSENWGKVEAVQRGGVGKIGNMRCGTLETVGNAKIFKDGPQKQFGYFTQL